MVAGLSPVQGCSSVFAKYCLLINAFILTLHNYVYIYMYI